MRLAELLKNAVKQIGEEIARTRLERGFQENLSLREEERLAHTEENRPQRDARQRPWKTQRTEDKHSPRQAMAVPRGGRAVGKALPVSPKPARGNQARRPAGFGTNDIQTIPFIDKPRRRIMAFVNERVSEDDIRKYGLDELKREFHPFDHEWKNGRPEAFWYAWTIDRERDIYFMPVKMVTESGPSGLPEPTGRSIAVLNFQGRRVRLTIERTYCSSSLSDVPFRVAWNLHELDTSAVPEIPRATVISVLKEALTVYGHRGAYSQRAPNTVVEFGF